MPFGHRLSLLGHPVTRRGIGPSSRSAYRPNGRTSTGFPRSARTSCDRGGRPLYPGDDGAHPDRWRLPAGVCRFAAARPCTPLQLPSLRGLRLTRESTRVPPIRPSGLPQPVAARMERAALGLKPRASHPADPEPDDARRGGDRPSSTDLELPAQLTFSVDLESGSSLNACDLASHVAIPIVRVPAVRRPKQSSPRTPAGGCVTPIAAAQRRHRGWPLQRQSGSPHQADWRAPSRSSGQAQHR